MPPKIRLATTTKPIRWLRPHRSDTLDFRLLLMFTSSRASHSCATALILRGGRCRPAANDASSIRLVADRRLLLYGGNRIHQESVSAKASFDRGRPSSKSVELLSVALQR